jgi:hypothetical protein
MSKVPASFKTGASAKLRSLERDVIGRSSAESDTEEPILFGLVEGLPAIASAKIYQHGDSTSYLSYSTSLGEGLLTIVGQFASIFRDSKGKLHRFTQTVRPV